MVTSGGRTASTLYTKKKGVSPVSRLSDVRLTHSAHRSSSIHFFAMLLQAIIVARLQTFEDLCIGSLYLVIALWMGNGRIADLDVQILVVPLEGSPGKLGPVVGDDPIQDPKPIRDQLDEHDSKLLFYFDHRSRFWPLGEFVDCDVEIPIPSDGSGKQPQDVQPHTVNGHEGGIICSIYTGVWIYWYGIAMPCKSIPA
jgi:hypothetical protein